MEKMSPEAKVDRQELMAAAIKAHLEAAAAQQARDKAYAEVFEKAEGLPRSWGSRSGGRLRARAVGRLKALAEAATKSAGVGGTADLQRLTPPCVREVVRRLEMISHFQRAGRRVELAYSTERRAAVLKKLEPPNAVPLRQLAKDEGISEATLHIWRRDARSQGRLLPDADAGPDGWTSRDKFAAVLETAALNEVDLAAYCRQRGLYAEQIQAWRTACEQANDWARASSQRLGQATKDDKKQIKALERDLARKEKALAEAAALLVLRKNAAAIWGDGEDA